MKSNAISSITSWCAQSLAKVAALIGVMALSYATSCHKETALDETPFERTAVMTANLYPSISTTGTAPSDTGVIELEANVPTLRGYYFETNGPGTFVLLSTEVVWGGCRRDHVTISTWIKTWSADGQLEQAHALEPHWPLRLSKGTRATLEVALRSPEACDGVSVRTVVKFYEQKAGDGHTYRGGGEQGTVEGDGTDGRRAVDNPPALHENPPITLPPPQEVAPCEALQLPLPVGAPAGLGARVELYARNSTAEGCKRTMVWNTWDNARRSRVDDCRISPVSAVVEGQSSAAQLVKWQEDGGALARQLFWVNGGSQATAAQMSDTLKRGTVLRLSRDESCTGTAAQPLVALNNDSDLLFFAGDPRMGPYQTVGVPAIMMLNPTVADALKINYRYDRGSAADRFFLEVNWKFKDTSLVPDMTRAGIKVAFFNKRTRSFVTEWAALSSASFSAGSWKLTDAATLHRVLPRMGEMELMLAREDSQKGVVGTFALYSAFNDPTFTNTFSDLTTPGRNRFLVKEEDLP